MAASATAVVVVLATMAALVATAAPAWAHADVIEADPGPGTGLPTAPGEVVMRFTEPLIVQSSSIRVLDATGADVGEGPTRAVEGDAQAMRRTLGLLAPGVYRVEWTTVSPLDGHTLRGSYTFAVGAQAGSENQVLANPLASEGWLGLLGRYAALGGLLVWFGLLALSGVSGRLGVDLWRTDRCVRAAGVAAAVGTAVALVSTGPVSGLGAVVLSRSGTARGVVVVAAVVGAAVGAGSAGRRRVGMALAAVAVVAEAAAGHAATSPHPTVATVSFAIHVGAAGVWVGAVALAVQCRDRLVAALGVLSPWAIGAAVVVVVTGALNSVAVLAAVRDLATTGYGVTLAIKGAAVAGMAALGWVHHRRRQRHQPGLWRPVRAEAATAALVVLAATALVGFPNPPGEEERSAEHAAGGQTLLDELPTRPAVSVATTAGPYVAGLAVLPPEPGDVEVQLQLLGAEPGDGLRDARVDLIGPDGGTSTVALEPCGAACFSGSAQLERRGDWTFRSTVVSNRGPVAFSETIPVPTPAGDAVLERALQAMEDLDSLTVRERLSEEADRGPVLRSMYEFRAPNAMEWAVVDGSTRIGIGDQGYIRSRPGEPFTTYDWPDPGMRWPRGFYRSFFGGATAVRLLGTDTVGGSPADIVAFVQPAYPAWQRLWVDRATGRLLRLEMRAERHVMDQRYAGFDQPVTIRPPTDAATPD